MRQRLTWIGTVLRSRSLEEKIAVTQAFETQVLPFFEDGTLKALVDQTLPFSQVVEATLRMARNEAFGKIVLTWD